MNHFIKAIESSFDNVQSECTLERALYDLDVIAPLQKCEIFESRDKIREKSKKKKKKQEKAIGTALETDGRKRSHKLVGDENSETDDDIIEQESSIEDIIKGINNIADR